jgi:hypothetical protein
MDPGDLKCREIKLDFAKRDKCKPVLLRLSLAGNLQKPLMSLYGTERKERVYGLWADIQRRGSILAWSGKW